MNPKRAAEIARLLRHEERMRQHPRDLFPKPQGTGRRVLCRGCGEEFTQPPIGGKQRVWCSLKCRDKVWQGAVRARRAARKATPRLPTGPQRVAPSQPCPLGAGSGLGDATPEG